MNRLLSTFVVSLLFTLPACPERTSIMEISFVRSGGMSAAMTRVQGSVNLKDEAREVSGDADYKRTMDAGEVDTLRAGADPSVLPAAAAQIKKRGSAGEHYLINVKTSDGKSNQVDLNLSGNPEELKGVSPAAAKFLGWVQQEADKIYRRKMTGK